EKVPYEAQALRLLARAADGSMRDALSLTDQAIAYSANQVNEEAVRGMLGALDQSYLIRLLDALAQGDGATVLTIADEMALRMLAFEPAPTGGGGGVGGSGVQAGQAGAGGSKRAGAPAVAAQPRALASPGSVASMGGAGRAGVGGVAAAASPVASPVDESRD